MNFLYSLGLRLSEGSQYGLKSSGHSWSGFSICSGHCKYRRASSSKRSSTHGASASEAGKDVRSSEQAASVVGTSESYSDLPRSSSLRAASGFGTSTSEPLS